MTDAPSFPWTPDNSPLVDNRLKDILTRKVGLITQYVIVGLKYDDEADGEITTRALCQNKDHRPYWGRWHDSNTPFMMYRLNTEFKAYEILEQIKQELVYGVPDQTIFQQMDYVKVFKIDYNADDVQVHWSESSQSFKIADALDNLTKEQITLLGLDGLANRVYRDLHTK